MLVDAEKEERGDSAGRACCYKSKNDRDKQPGDPSLVRDESVLRERHIVVGHEDLRSLPT